MTHICKAPGCKAEISEEFLMCSIHWQMVPVELRREVNTTWRLFSASRGTGVENTAARLQLIDNYQKKQAEAIQAFRNIMEGNPVNASQR